MRLPMSSDGRISWDCYPRCHFQHILNRWKSRPCYSRNRYGEKSLSFMFHGELKGRFSWPGYFRQYFKVQSNRWCGNSYEGRHVYFVRPLR